MTTVKKKKTCLKALVPTPFVCPPIYRKRDSFVLLFHSFHSFLLQSSAGQNKLNCGILTQRIQAYLRFIYYCSIIAVVRDCTVCTMRKVPYHGTSCSCILDTRYKQCFASVMLAVFGRLCFYFLLHACFDTTAILALGRCSCYTVLYFTVMLLPYRK